ncbi:hypothetical protein CGLAMM_01185 [Acetobacteraceae bacterium EV16G]|uniref:Uncharacterized protein n=1 Tax=Sorlinia euscelidii TaxID=3081148 RepID=A0ABU7U188_9PROT
MTKTSKNHDFTLPTPIMMDGELRINDLLLAEMLGFAQPLNVRKLIRRHAKYLAKIATISTVETVTRGQHGTEFFLTEEQASYIGMLSQTPQAAEGRIALIKAFRKIKQEVQAHRFETTSATAAALTKMTDLLATLTTRVEMLEGRKPARTGAATRPALAQRVKQQGTLFGLPEDAAMPEVFQPIAAYLDLTAIAPKRRFIIAGRAAQSCGNWLMKHRMSAFIRASHETGRLLFHPEGVEAWLAARSKVQEAAR